jgi:hypothetical protein
MTKRTFADSPTSPTATLAAPLNAGDGSITLTADPGTEMPTTGPFTVLVGESPDTEPANCASRSGTTVTLVAAWTGATFPAGAPVNTGLAAIDAEAFIQQADLDAAIDANPGPQGPQGDPGPQGATGAAGPNNNLDGETLDFTSPANGEVIQRVSGTWINRALSALGLTKSDVGLGSVDNTADTAKPVSTAQQTALDGKVDLAGDTMTGALSLGLLLGKSNLLEAAPSQYAYDNYLDGYLQIGDGAQIGAGATIISIAEGLITLYGASLQRSAVKNVAPTLSLTLDDAPVIVTGTVSGTTPTINMPSIGAGWAASYTIVNKSTSKSIRIACGGVSYILGWAGDTQDDSQKLTLPAAASGRVSAVTLVWDGVANWVRTA